MLAERGHSLTPSHVAALYKKAHWPITSVAAKDLKQAIVSWDKDVRLWEMASLEGDRMILAHRKLALEEMCPDRPRAHPRIFGPETLQTYEAMRAEISEWLFDEFKKLTKPGARLCEGSQTKETQR